MSQKATCEACKLERLLARTPRVVNGPGPLSAEESHHRLRVACFAHLSEVSGAVTSLLAMAERLDITRFDTTFIVPGNGPILDRANKTGVRTVLIPNLEISMASQATIRSRISVFRQRLAYIRTVARFLKSEHIDIAFISSVHSIFAGIGALLAGVPIVWHVHETIESPSMATRFKLRIVESLSKALLYDSHSGQRRFPAHRVKLQKVQLNWIELDKLRQHNAAEEAEVRNSLQVLETQPIVLSNGIIPRKGPDTFAAAALLVIDRLKPANQPMDLPVFVLTGTTGDEHAEFVRQLKSYVTTQDLSQHVRFAGVRDDLPALLRCASIYVSPSRNEALPITMVEAMAAGTPVIATDVGDCREFLMDGKLGTITPDDPGLLAEKILALLEDKGTAKQAATIAQQHVLQLYEPGTFFTAVENMLMQVARPKITQHPA